MRPARLNDLPAPPEGKAGWPWTEAPEPLPPAMANGAPWPLISIVTPSYNQGAFIEETIRSILLQGYPALQYIVFDGGSSDESVAVIEKYAPWIDHWKSEPDRGQGHAINKGIALCSGEIFNWVNSDDVLTPGALRTVAQTMGSNDAVAGWLQNFDASGPVKVSRNRNITPYNLAAKRNDVAMMQPAIWVRTENLRLIGEIDEKYTCSFDAQLLYRYFFRYPKVAYAPEILINFRLHPQSKTVSRSATFLAENIAMLRNFLRDPAFDYLWTPMRSRLRKLCWRRLLNGVVAAKGMPPVRKLRVIVTGALARPQVGLSSATVKAVKAVVRGGWADETARARRAGCQSDPRSAQQATDHQLR